MSDGFFTCGIGSSGAAAEVLSHFRTLDQFTTKFVEQALTFTDKLGTFQLPNLSFTVPVVDVTKYSITAPGALPTLGAVSDKLFTDTVPTAPNYVNPNPVSLDPLVATAPEVPAPTFALAPGVYSPTFRPPVELTDIVNPVFGDHTRSIIPPTPRNIVLPTLPVINWDAITFDTTPPAFTAVPPDARDFAFTPDTYTVKIADQVKPAILAMLNGTTGLPAAVENAIWARAAERESMLAFRAEQEAVGTDASRGFTIPSGVLNAARARVRQDAQDKRVTLSRDTMIRTHEVLIEQLKFAVAQGLAYETLFIQLYSTVQGLRLDAAKFAVNIALQVFQAFVTKFQVDAELTRLRAELARDQIQVALGKLQGYEAQLRADQIIGQLNQQDLDRYLGLLNAVLTDAKIYEAEISAAKLLIDEQSLKLQQERTQIDAELAKLQASDIEARIWSSSIQAEATKQSAWGTRAQTYVAQVQAWGTEQNVKIENLRAQIAANGDITARYEAGITGFNAKANYVRTQAELIVQNNQTAIQGYSAQTSGLSSFNLATIEQMRNHITALQQNVELAIKNGEINVQNSLEGKRLEEQALSTATQALSQLSSSALSGHSTSANIGDTSSQNYGCSYSTSQSFST